MSQASGSVDVIKDEHTVFIEFVAHELRNLKTDQCRGELKRAIQKCILELAEKDEAIAAKQNE